MLDWVARWHYLLFSFLFFFNYGIILHRLTQKGLTGWTLVQDVKPLSDDVANALSIAFGRYYAYLDSFKPDEGYLKKKVENELGMKLIHLKMRCSGLGGDWGKVCSTLSLSLSSYLSIYFSHTQIHVHIDYWWLSFCGLYMSWIFMKTLSLQTTRDCFIVTFMPSFYCSYLLSLGSLGKFNPHSWMILAEISIHFPKNS